MLFKYWKAPTIRNFCLCHPIARSVSFVAAESDASIQESQLLVACCVDTILGEVRVVVTCQRMAVTCQRCHGNTAGECEDEDHCGYKGLHGWPRWCSGGMALEHRHRRRPRKKRA